MKIIFNTLLHASLLSVACASLDVLSAETKCAPSCSTKRVQISDEEHKKNLAELLPQIANSESIGLMNWHRDRARDKDGGWVKLTLTAEQLAEVKPILARMLMNPQASLKPTLANSCGYNMPMTNWRFVDAEGKEFFVSMTYDMTADLSTGADWLLSEADLASLASIVDKYIAAAQK